MDTKLTSLEQTLGKLESGLDSDIFQEAMTQYNELYNQWQQLQQMLSEKPLLVEKPEFDKYHQAYQMCIDPSSPIEDAIKGYHLARNILNEQILELDKTNIEIN